MQRPVIEVRGSEPRRRHSLEFKRRIVEEVMKPDVSVARVARANGVNANQVFGWRKLYLEGRLGDVGPTLPRLLPVTVVPDTPDAAAVPDRSVARNEQVIAAHLRIESAKGCLTIEGRPDAATLNLVLERFLG